MVINGLSSSKLVHLAPVLSRCADRGVTFSLDEDDQPLVCIWLRDEASGEVVSFVGDTLAEACADAVAFFDAGTDREAELAERKAYGRVGP